MELSIRSDRIKRIEVKGEDGTVLGEVVFNPYDLSVYRKYTEIRMNLAKNKKNYEELVKEYDAIPKDVEESTMMDTGEYEKLNNLYQAESNMSTGITQIFVDLKSGIDNLFGEGIFDLFTQGYQDEVMLDPLFEAVKPFFEEAGKDRQSKVDSVKLNRAERRSIKK